MRHLLLWSNPNIVRQPQCCAETSIVRQLYCYEVASLFWVYFIEAALLMEYSLIVWKRGSRKLWTFSTFWGIFYSGLSPYPPATRIATTKTIRRTLYHLLRIQCFPISSSNLKARSWDQGITVMGAFLHATTILWIFVTPSKLL